jgi:hypothetical protein
LIEYSSQYSTDQKQSNGKSKAVLSSNPNSLSYAETLDDAVFGSVSEFWGLQTSTVARREEDVKTYDRSYPVRIASGLTTGNVPPAATSNYPSISEAMLQEFFNLRDENDSKALINSFKRPIIANGLPAFDPDDPIDLAAEDAIRGMYKYSGVVCGPVVLPAVPGDPCNPKLGKPYPNPLVLANAIVGNTSTGTIRINNHGLNSMTLTATSSNGNLAILSVSSPVLASAVGTISVRATCTAVGTLAYDVLINSSDPILKPQTVGSTTFQRKATVKITCAAPPPKPAKPAATVSPTGLTFTSAVGHTIPGQSITVTSTGDAGTTVELNVYPASSNNWSSGSSSAGAVQMNSGVSPQALPGGKTFPPPPGTLTWANGSITVAATGAQSLPKGASTTLTVTPTCTAAGPAYTAYVPIAYFDGSSTFVQTSVAVTVTCVNQFSALGSTPPIVRVKPVDVAGSAFETVDSSFSFTNTGPAPLNFKVTPTPGLVSLTSRASGVLGVGQTETVNAKMTCKPLAPGVTDVDIIQEHFKPTTYVQVNDQDAPSVQIFKKVDIRCGDIWDFPAGNQSSVNNNIRAYDGVNDWSDGGANGFCFVFDGFGCAYWTGGRNVGSNPKINSFSFWGPGDGTTAIKLLSDAINQYETGEIDYVLIHNSCANEYLRSKHTARISDIDAIVKRAFFSTQFEAYLYPGNKVLDARAQLINHVDPTINCSPGVWIDRAWEDDYVIQLKVLWFMQ